MLVQQILKTKPSQHILTIDPAESVAAAAKIMSDRRVGALVVSAGGNIPGGIVSERDIVREIGREGSGVLQRSVSSIMSKPVISCHVEDTADEVLAKMTEGRFRHMPVLDHGSMTGLISIGDVVKARLDELNLERDALEGMITGY